MSTITADLSISKKQHTFCYRLAEELAAKNGNGLVSWAQLIDVLTETGLKQILAAQKVRYLIDTGQLIPLNHSGTNMFLLYRNITEFERRQKQLQDSWLAGNEMAALQVAHEESREFRLPRGVERSRK